MPTVLHFHPAPRLTIQEAMEQFLDYQVTRAPGVVHVEYERYLNIVMERLNRRDPRLLTPAERARLVSYPDKTFCQLLSPERLLPEARSLLEAFENGEIDGDIDYQNLKGLVRRLAVWIGKQGMKGPA